MSSWGGGFGGGGGFWGFQPQSAAQQLLYNSPQNGGAQAFFGSLAEFMGGGSQSNMSQFLRSQYGTEWNRYLTDPRAFNPDFNWTSYLQGRQGDLQNSYYGLSASQRGARPGAFTLGREQW